MKNKKLFWLVYHIVILVISIISAMIMKYNQTGKAFVPETILVVATIFTMSALAGYFGVYIFNRLAKLSHKELNKKIVPAFLLFLVAIIIIANIVISIGVYIWYIIKGIDLSTFLSNLCRHELYPANKSLSVWLVLISLVFFYSLWKKSSVKEQMLREENLKYKYRNLKSQVNPHFLFNSLNTLSELVYDDAKKADDYIQKLSGIYRYVLENEEIDLISLKDELDFIRQYFNLQKVRDQDKIFLEIDVQGESEFKIIPVSLQLLVENVLKHNSMSREKPLVVKIFISGDYIVVSNTIQRKNTLENSTQMGLSNLKERVNLIVGREMIVTEEKNQFIVKLPIIRLPK